jgi:regulator of protease activity HflC (stomatin/prohibitin superfamily)
MAYVTVWEWERGVRFRHGVFVDELGPGRYRCRKGEKVQGVDTRPNSYTMTGQEVPTADGVLVRVSLALRWAVTDATRYVRSAEKPLEEMHLAAQLDMRTAVLSRTHEELDAQRTEVAEEISAALTVRATELGVTVHSVAVRDVVLPFEIRRALLGELVARKEGQATLERARTETAALRSLLNAARLAEEHPALLQLRTLQAASQPGTTVVFERPR